MLLRVSGIVTIKHTHLDCAFVSHVVRGLGAGACLFALAGLFVANPANAHEMTITDYTLPFCVGPGPDTELTGIIEIGSWVGDYTRNWWVNMKPSAGNVGGHVYFQWNVLRGGTLAHLSRFSLEVNDWSYYWYQYAGVLTEHGAPSWELRFTLMNYDTWGKCFDLQWRALTY